MVSLHARHSTSSEQSNGSTAVDPLSVQQSPKNLTGFTERKKSLDNSSSQQVTTARACCTLHKVRDEPFVPRDRRGWPNLAQIMSEVPEYAAFSRFRELNVKNLLYYQAELDVFQQDLTIHEEEITIDVTCYQYLVEDGKSCYHELLIKNRRLLREYNEALLQFTNICALPDPESLNMRSLRSWLTSMSEHGGKKDICGKFGTDKTWGSLDPEVDSKALSTRCWEVFVALVWAKDPPTSDEDLVSTMPDVKIDGLTRWVAYYLAPLWWEIKATGILWRESKTSRQDKESTEPTPKNVKKAKKDKRGKKGKKSRKRDIEVLETLESISEHTALRFTSGLTTVTACLMPVVAIAVLTQVSGTRDLLLCITGFAVMFAILLIFLTRGTSSRTDIFAATAAFSAVLVVFISTPVINIQMPPGTNSPVISL